MVKIKEIKPYQVIFLARILSPLTVFSCPSIFLVEFLMLCRFCCHAFRNAEWRHCQPPPCPLPSPPPRYPTDTKPVGLQVM